MVGKQGAGKRRKPSGSSARPGNKRKQSAESSAFDDRADFFLAEDDEFGDQPAAGDGGSEEEDEDEEDLETADEKRLRLAKSYLDRVREQEAEYGSDDEDGEGSEGGEDGGYHRVSGEAEGTDALRDRISSRLQKDFMEGGGYAVRKVAQNIRIPETTNTESANGDGRLLRGHRLSVTGLALTADDATAFSVSKDGSLLRWDVETGARTKMNMAELRGGAPSASSGPDWVLQQGKRESGANKALLAVAVSSDARYLATGGGSGAVHVWDVRSNAHIKSLKSHKDAVTGLAFREGEATLYSSSFDRSVKIWSLSEMAYVDTLYGHQSEVLAVDARRAERCVSTGNDQTCRVWKIPEESQLVFRGHVSSIDCCAYVSTSDWMTGSTDGSLSLWSPMRKKAVFTLRDSHGLEQNPPTVPSPDSLGRAAAWVQSVGCSWGTDLAASGAGDGALKLWKVGDGRHGKTLAALGQLPARGFVNALKLARSGRFVLAGMGQEPRLGRWARDSRAKNGVLLHRLEIHDEQVGEVDE